MKIKKARASRTSVSSLTVALLLGTMSSAPAIAQSKDAVKPPRSETEYTLQQLRGDDEAAKAALERIRAEAGAIGPANAYILRQQKGDGVAGESAGAE